VSDATVNEASNVKQRLILLHEPAFGKKEGDSEKALQQINGRVTAIGICEGIRTSLPPCGSVN
jgi:hypothetical protein